MEIDEALLQTQTRLTAEGRNLSDLLGHFRNRISPVLIGEVEWIQLLNCAAKLPTVMGAHPIGFEIPLQTCEPRADLCVALASGTHSAEHFLAQAKIHSSDDTARAISLLLKRIEKKNSQLREIVGRKIMLQFVSASDWESRLSLQSLFLKPDLKPILGTAGREIDVGIVAKSLADSFGWSMRKKQLNHLQQVYLAQPGDTRMDSFSINPSKSHAIQLSILGFSKSQDVRNYLANVAWTGQLSVVDGIIARFAQRMPLAKVGLNVDVGEKSIEPTLGLILIVEQRQTKDSRYWLDGLTDWNPVLQALGQENIIIPEKLQALASWPTKPTRLFASSGHYIMLCGIHHIKLVIDQKGLVGVKAYVYMALSDASAA